MKKQYFAPTVLKTALSARPIMTTVSVRGNVDGEARAHQFFETFPWEEETDEEIEY